MLGLLWLLDIDLWMFLRRFLEGPLCLLSIPWDREPAALGFRASFGFRISDCRAFLPSLPLLYETDDPSIG